MEKDYQNFLEDLAARESGGNYGIVNSYGYLGKYQMGEAALIDAGYYTKDGTSNNDWKGNWTGKDGVENSMQFLQNDAAQETAIREYMGIQWKYIEHYKLDEYVGKELNGITITESGLLAGAHLKGALGLKQALDQDLDGEFTDGYGTDIQEYIQKFGDYDTPYELDIQITEEEEENETVATDETQEEVTGSTEQIENENKADDWGDEGMDTSTGNANNMEIADEQNSSMPENTESDVDLVDDLDDNSTTGISDDSSDISTDVDDNWGSDW